MATSERCDSTELNGCVVPTCPCASCTDSKKKELFSALLERRLDGPARLPRKRDSFKALSALRILADYLARTEAYPSECNTDRRWTSTITIPSKAWWSGRCGPAKENEPVTHPGIYTTPKASA